MSMEFHTSRWLEAHVERNAGLTTLPRNLVLADIFGDGDFRLILVDLQLGQEVQARLKIYKGTGLASDQILPDLPSCVVSFYQEVVEPYLPVVGVGCGPEFFIYKNSKPFFKFTVPSTPLSAVEKDAWQKLPHVTNQLDYEAILEELRSVPLSSLSSRSQHLLFLPPENIKDEVDKYLGTEPIKRSPITCASILKKNLDDDIAASCPVIGTEDGQIFVLDPITFAILQQAPTCSTRSSPFIIQSTGLYDVEFRIIIACRENHVCILRQEWTEGRILFRTSSNIIDMALIPTDKSVVVAVSEKTLCCYSKRGNKLWSVSTLHQISCLCLLSLKRLSTFLIGVGMRSGAVHFYQGRHPVDCISVPDTPSAMIFGQMGQEEHVLVIITLAGALNFKILKRTADFNLSNQESISAPNIENKPLPLPKRSKLFLEQSMREREHAVDIHKKFQEDLIRIRLQAARKLLYMQTDQNTTGNEKELVKLSAQVMGLGPIFTLIVNVDNMSGEKALMGLSVIFHCKTPVYRLSSYVIVIPLIPPSLTYKTEIKVNEVRNEEESHVMIASCDPDHVVRVFVIKEGQTRPLLTATINMPSTDPLAFGL